MRATPDLAGMMLQTPMRCWDASDEARCAAPPVLAGRRRPSRGLRRELLAGAALLATWIVLWTIFIAGVVEPAAGFYASARRAGTTAAPGAEVVAAARAGARERSGR